MKTKREEKKTIIVRGRCSVCGGTSSERKKKITWNI